MAQSWIFFTVHQEHKHDRSQAHHDREAGSKQDSGDNCQWTHSLIRSPQGDRCSMGTKFA
jgi:hypothetical protein